MMLQRDPRINARTMRFRNYLMLFLVILSVCGGCAAIYFGQQSKEVQAEELYVILSLVTYIVIVSIVLLVVFAIIRNYSIMRPVHTISNAARKVAQGDYSVRIPQQRKDGKKDEFEVLYEDFNVMVSEIASTEMMKKDFISNISHELKTPLSVIHNYATILQSDSLTETERYGYAKRIMEETDRLSVIVANILQISRLENQKITAEKKPFNLSEQVCRCAVGYEYLWEEKEIEFETDFDQNIIITNDEKLLDIVWNNLISNALKFTPFGGNVTVIVKQVDDKAVVTVSDTGCGIGEGQMSHIFEKFYQSDSSHGTEGNGLGLAMVKEILALTGGNISVESTLGNGSAFSVFLPSV